MVLCLKQRYSTTVFGDIRLSLGLVNSQQLRVAATHLCIYIYINIHYVTLKRGCILRSANKSTFAFGLCSVGFSNTMFLICFSIYAPDLCVLLLVYAL